MANGFWKCIRVKMKCPGIHWGEKETNFGTASELQVIF
jgi:hypothetical protein